MGAFGGRIVATVGRWLECCLLQLAGRGCHCWSLVAPGLYIRVVDGPGSSRGTGRIMSNGMVWLDLLLGSYCDGC